MTKQLNKKILTQLLKASVHVIGVDEVGRGCLAGPVCAGVVIFKPGIKTRFSKYVDSKTIPEETRERLSDEITTHHYAALGWSSVEEIDQINILQASLLAMKRAVLALHDHCHSMIDFDQSLIVVDGRDVIPNFEKFKQQPVIKGDSLVRQISAASIIAKVARDNLMKKLSSEYSHYGFESHKGYGTEIHRHAIKKFGITPHHRKSFFGVKEHVVPATPDFITTDEFR